MSKQRDAFFAGDMYLVDVRGWPADLVYPAAPITSEVDAPAGARLVVTAMHPHDRRPLPPAAAGASALMDTTGFRMRHSGNRTLTAPKHSWAITFGPMNWRAWSSSTSNRCTTIRQKCARLSCWGLFHAALFNALILAIAVVMLTWHNVWIARHGKELAGELRAAGQAVVGGSKSLLALAVVVGVAVLREGSEVVLFLYGVLREATILRSAWRSAASPGFCSVRWSAC